MQQRIFAVALALCVVVPLLSGCDLLFGGSEEPPPAPAPQPANPNDNQSSQESTASEATTDQMERVTVPSLVGMDARDAQKTLRNLGLDANFRFKHDDEDHLTVLSQSIKAGEMVASGSYVRLTVSLGPEPEVPLPPEVEYQLELLLQQQLEQMIEDAGGSTSGSGSGTQSSAQDNINDIPGVPLPNSPVSGTLTIADNKDVYRVYLAAGQTIQLSLNTGGSTSNPDFRMYVYPPGTESLGGTTVAEVTTGDYPRNITYTASTTGDFYIRILHAGTDQGSGGDYELVWSIGI
ncbi:MAG: hypothetical protein Kow0056_11510 [Coriobacteriia bacterium]